MASYAYFAVGLISTSGRRRAHIMDKQSKKQDKQYQIPMVVTDESSAILASSRRMSPGAASETASAG